MDVSLSLYQQLVPAPRAPELSRDSSNCSERGPRNRGIDDENSKDIRDKPQKKRPEQPHGFDLLIVNVLQTQSQTPVPEQPGNPPVSPLLNSGESTLSAPQNESAGVLPDTQGTGIADQQANMPRISAPTDNAAPDLPTMSGDQVPSAQLTSTQMDPAAVRSELSPENPPDDRLLESEPVSSATDAQVARTSAPQNVQLDPAPAVMAASPTDRLSHAIPGSMTTTMATIRASHS
ncbi:MAG: hypothetical protein KDA85_09095, partial [Planctomycetaceae bacterium]|nr:hypothetical protein [Planctomycetaceae bacterium]